METQDNAAIIRELFDAFNDHDLDRATSMVSEDFELVLRCRGPGLSWPTRLTPVASNLLDDTPRRHYETLQRGRHRRRLGIHRIYRQGHPHRPAGRPGWHDPADRTEDRVSGRRTDAGRGRQGRPRARLLRWCHPDAPAWRVPSPSGSAGAHPNLSSK